MRNEKNSTENKIKKFLKNVEQYEDIFSLDYEDLNSLLENDSFDNDKEEND